MKKYLLLFSVISAFTFTSCSKDDEGGDVEKGKAQGQVVITLKTADGKVKEGYHVFAFEKLDYIKNNELGKAVESKESDENGQVTFSVALGIGKTYYFQAYKKISKDTYNPKSRDPIKIDLKNGSNLKSDIIVQ